MANVRDMGSPAKLGTKSITVNGTYNASSDNLDGFSQVSVNVPGATLGTKSITENGTYNASSDNLDGYSQVIVDVATGVPIMSRSDWDNLTEAQKQSYGYVAIQDASTGYLRGELVYGADYVEIGKYIPYSPQNSVICEAYVDNFIADALSWGVGDNPITFNSAPVKDTSENAIDIKVASQGKLAYCDLGANNTVFTAYAVLKLVNPSQYSRIISAMANRSVGYGILLYGNPLTVSSWGSDTPTSQASNVYFACALQYSGSNIGKGGILNSIISKTVNASGRYVTLGRTDTDPSTTNAEPCDIMVRYCAVTNSADSETVINNNLNNLIAEFIN